MTEIRPVALLAVPDIRHACTCSNSNEQPETTTAAAPLRMWSAQRSDAQSKGRFYGLGLAGTIMLHLALVVMWIFHGSLFGQPTNAKPITVVNIVSEDIVEQEPQIPEPAFETPPVNLTFIPPDVRYVTPPPPSPRAPTAAIAPIKYAPPKPQANQAVIDNFHGKLLGHLNRFKRYPGSARSRRQEGVTYVRFTMDRTGHILSARLEESCGHKLLDEESLALLRRAEPLPIPPSDVRGARIEMIVPVEFSLRR